MISPDLAIIPQNLKKIEIDNLFLGTVTDYSMQVQQVLLSMKESLPYVFSKMPLLEEFQFTNFPWSRSFLRRCLQALKNSPRLKILKFMELYWDVTLPIIQDVANLSPLLENVTLECDGMMKLDDGERNDNCQPFDAVSSPSALALFFLPLLNLIRAPQIKLAQTLSPLRNIHTLSINYAIEPTTPAIIAALSPPPTDPCWYVFRVIEHLRDKDLEAFNNVRSEYLAIVSDVVRAFAARFPKLDYLNLAVWESAQCLDGNEIALLRVDTEGEGRKCIGWKQVLPMRGMGKLDVRLDERYMEVAGDGVGRGKDVHLDGSVELVIGT